MWEGGGFRDVFGLLSALGKGVNVLRPHLTRVQGVWGVRNTPQDKGGLGALFEKCARLVNENGVFKPYILRL